MTLGELIAAVRANELDDEAEPHLWSDASLIQFAAEAQEQAARRARLFVDSSTVACCQIAVTAILGALYALDSRVIRVNRARIGTEPYPLGLVMVRDMDREAPGWQEETSSMPTHAVVDFESNKLRLYPTPTASLTLNMTVVRMPLTTPNDMDDTLEVRDEQARHLRHWIAYRAFGKRDSETYNPERAADELLMFEREFGAVRPIFDEVWMNQFYLGDAYNGRY